MKIKILGKEKFKGKDGRSWVNIHGLTDMKIDSSAGSNYGGVKVLTFMLEHKPELDKLLIGAEYTAVTSEYMRGSQLVSRIVNLV